MLNVYIGCLFSFSSNVHKTCTLFCCYCEYFELRNMILNYGKLKLLSSFRPPPLYTLFIDIEFNSFDYLGNYCHNIKCNLHKKGLKLLLQTL
jgi:hypothetical protein